jgi:hypothetical protein
MNERTRWSRVLFTEEDIALFVLGEYFNIKAWHDTLPEFRI